MALLSSLLSSLPQQRVGMRRHPLAEFAAVLTPSTRLAADSLVAHVAAVCCAMLPPNVNLA
jgi:hypothetical protein